MSASIGDMTSRQAEALAFIGDTISSLGRPPTIREIGLAMGISSTNGVRYFLGALEERGLIERSRRVSRGIRLPGRPRAFSRRTRRPLLSLSSPDRLSLFPLVGRVAAGEPLLAEQNIEEILTLDPSLFPYHDGAFALRVKGESMKGAGILDGDLVIVRPDPTPSNGQIVVAFWNEEATVKRLYRRGKRVVLHPENESYADLEIPPHARDFRVLGRVVGVLRRFGA